MISQVTRYMADRAKFVSGILLFILIITNIQVNIMEVAGKRFFKWISNNKKIDLKLYIYAKNIEFFQDIRMSILNNITQNSNIKLEASNNADCVIYAHKPKPFEPEKQLETSIAKATLQSEYGKDIYFKSYNFSKLIPMKSLEDEYTLRFKSTNNNYYFIKCKEDINILQVKLAMELIR